MVLLLIGVGILGLRVKDTLDTAVQQLTLGRNQLVAGAGILKGAGTGLTSAQTEQAKQHFDNARVHFSDGHALLAQSRLIGVIRQLPWAGTQVRAATELSDAGVHGSRMGVVLADALGTVLAEEPSGTKRSSVSPGVKILDALTALDPKLDELSRELNSIRADRARLPSTGLMPQLQSAVTQFDQKLDIKTVQDGIATLRADEPAIRQLLGSSGPQTYLVVQQDSAELRATGGFIGSFGFLSFDRGKMGPFAPKDIYSIDNDALGRSVLGPPGTRTHVDPPFPLQQTFHLTSWALRDSNWSPDFPTSARQAEDFLNREAGRSVDGVIAIDPYLIQKLLSVIGPTTVPETGDVVDDKNFFATTLRRVEVSPSVSHKAFLAEAANAIFARLLALPPGKWPALLQALAASCDARSLQVYFHDASLTELVDRSHCDGRVRTLSSDGLMIVDSNVGGNKDDFWLQRSFVLQIKMNSDGSARHQLRLHYSGLSAHGFLTGQWGYTGWLRIYLPPSSAVVSVSGTSLAPATELGRKLLEGWVYVQFDHTADVTVVYDVDAGAMQSGGANQLLFEWQKQAGRPGDQASVELTLPSGWTLRSGTVGATPARDGPILTGLSVDRLFSFRYLRG